MNTKQITLRLPDEVYEALKVISIETGLTVTTLILISIWNKIEQLDWLKR